MTMIVCNKARLRRSRRKTDTSAKVHQKRKTQNKKQREETNQGKEGEVEILLVHDYEREVTFVEDGYGLYRDKKIY